MGSKVNVIVFDDLDASVIGEEVKSYTFGYAGQDYEIDLGEKNAELLREGLAPFIKVARKVSKATVAKAERARVGKSGEHDAKEVRAWAAEHDLDAGARGRIPAKILEAFKAGDPEIAR